METNARLRGERPRGSSSAEASDPSRIRRRPIPWPRGVPPRPASRRPGAARAARASRSCAAGSWKTWDPGRVEHAGDAWGLSDEMTVREARDVYFREAGLSEEGYAARWVKLDLGPIPIVFPNTRGRVRAVRLHDLHHVATGYGTTWTGEAEIGAWELAAGCGRHYAAWVLNGVAALIGLVIAPRRTLRAWRRGRRSRTLYGGEFDEALLDLSVGELRRRLRLETWAGRDGAPGGGSGGILREPLGASRSTPDRDGARRISSSRDRLHTDP